MLYLIYILIIIKLIKNYLSKFNRPVYLFLFNKIPTIGTRKRYNGKSSIPRITKHKAQRKGKDGEKCTHQPVTNMLVRLTRPSQIYLVRTDPIRRKIRGNSRKVTRKTRKICPGCASKGFGNVVNVFKN